MAQKPKQPRDESGNPLKPGADDPGHAPESGEPTEMGFSHGKPIEKNDRASARQRDKGGDAKDLKSGRRGMK